MKHAFALCMGILPRVRTRIAPAKISTGSYDPPPHAHKQTCPRLSRQGCRTRCGRSTVNTGAECDCTRHILSTGSQRQASRASACAKIIRRPYQASATGRRKMQPPHDPGCGHPMLRPSPCLGCENAATTFVPGQPRRHYRNILPVLYDTLSAQVHFPCINLTRPHASRYEKARGAAGSACPQQAAQSSRRKKAKRSRL